VCHCGVSQYLSELCTSKRLHPPTLRFKAGPQRFLSSFDIRRQVGLCTGVIVVSRAAIFLYAGRWKRL
jgi:hypothetical protein